MNLGTLIFFENCYFSGTIMNSKFRNNVNVKLFKSRTIFSKISQNFFLIFTKKHKIFSYVLKFSTKVTQICDRAHKNEEPIQNQKFLLPTENDCLTFPLSPQQISEQNNHPLRSNCHLKLHFSVIKKSTFGTQTSESM